MAQLPDRISETFRAKTVFITGATGFIGKALVEKLLRVTDVKKIYLLVRPKKGKNADERIREIFDNVLFDLLKQKKPDAIKKCIPISGDMCEVELGIRTEDRELLKNEVDFIFHSAATTRFDISLRNAVILNTRGTKFVLDLAEDCKLLKLLIHVSTAYAFPNEKVMFEKPYDPPADPHDVLNSLEWLKNDAIFSKSILSSELPNSYTFSKALSEALVIEKLGKIPLIIVRPAIVIPATADPMPGWCNNLQGPIGMFVGAGKGVIRSMYMDSKSWANFVPVDSVVNAIMVAIWNHNTTKDALNIINMCMPECDVRISWKELMDIGLEVVSTHVPFNNILWYPGGTMTKSRALNNFNFVMFQLIPAVFIDLLLMLCRYKPILLQIQMRIRKGAEMFEFYTTRAWSFDTKNMEVMRKKLNEREKKIYELQRDAIDVKDYMSKAILWVRRHKLNETDDMLPSAKKTMKIMYVLDKLVKTLFLLGVAYYLTYMILIPIFGLRK